MTFLALALLTQLATSEVPAMDSRPTVFDAIDARFASGQIDQATRHLWRVAAIKNPALLPADLQLKQAAQPTAAARQAMTRVMFEAWQWASKHPNQGTEVQQLLLPPSDLPQVIESSRYPIRVSYDSSTSAAFAQQVLAASEHSWQVETEEYGFTPPGIESGAQFYRVHIEPTGMGGGAYTAPYDYDTNSRWTACFSYIVFDDGNPSDYIGSTMAHELNHAMQAAMDCGEIATFMENTATYIMSAVYPDSFWESVQYMPYFQQQPWRALDFMNERNSDLYEYGGVLLPLYLVGAYAASDGPVFMRQVWEACRQPWSSYDNVPSYYDAIAAVVGQRGGPTTLEPIFTDFSEARFFVGDNNDGSHIPNAQRLWGAEPTLTSHYTLRNLPVEQASPAYGEQPNPFGANFVQLDNLGEQPLRFDFDGQESARWEVRVVLYGGSEPTVSQTMALDPETWQGSLAVDPTGHSSAVMVVANLGDGSYDPNSRRWSPATYTYDLREVPPTPTLERIDPGTAEQGKTGLLFTVYGSNFVDSDRFNVEFLDPTVHITGFEVLASDQLRLKIDVDAEAPLGLVGIKVVNDDGAEATADLLEIVAPGADDPGALGCGCSSSAAGSNGALLALLGLAFGWRRRGR